MIDHLLSEPLDGFDIIYLRGNHEQSLMEFIEDPVNTRGWLQYGGLDTLLSYGVRLSKLPSNENELNALCYQFKNFIPDSHLNFMAATEYYYETGSYFFCHAGIKPGIALHRQQPSDLLWIRDKFVSSKKQHEKIIVHGHTISDEVDTQANRIGIDTGAYATGILTCLVLENDTQQVLQTSRDTNPSY